MSTIHGTNLFSLGAGKARRDAGMEQAASHRKEALIAAKAIARSIAHIHGSVSADEVIDELEKLNLSAGELGPAAGSIFKDKSVWEMVGWEPSKRASNHARYIRRWKLKASSKEDLDAWGDAFDRDRWIP